MHPVALYGDRLTGDAMAGRRRLGAGRSPLADRVSAESRPSEAPTPTRKSAVSGGDFGLLGLQRQAGNAATTAMVARLAGRAGIARGAGTSVVQRLTGDVGTLQRYPPGEIPSVVGKAVTELHENLVLKTNTNVAVVLEQLLLVKGHKKELKDDYQTSHKRDLDADLKAKLSWDNYARAHAYLEYGRLRVADKIYIAVKQPMADEVTVLRVVGDIHKLGSEDTNAEDEFVKEYGADFGPIVYKLPNGKSSKIAAAIFATRIGLSEDLGYKIAAILAFGKIRPIDKVVIAVAPVTSTNAPLLFDGLQSEQPKILKDDFKASYAQLAGGDLTQWITDKTTLHTENRALMLLDETVEPHQRLVRTIEISTSGYTTADSDFIFDALLHATAEQLGYLKAAIASKDPRVKNLYSGLGSLTKEDASRFDAMVGTGDNTGEMGDPNVLALRQAGGTGEGSVYLTLEMSTGVNHEKYRTAYFETNSKFRNFVDRYTSNNEKGWLNSMVLTDFRPRLNYAMNQNRDDYVLFLLNEAAAPEERRKLVGDAAFGAQVKDKSTALQNKILLALRPDSMTPGERAVWLDAAVKRETASGAGSLSATADAVTDENRELQAAIKRAGKNPSTEDQAEIDKLSAKTEAALTAFVKYRDELEALITQAVEMVAALVATVATGGAAAPELVLASLARAAMASAIAKVVANKLVKGDRFDVLGADGAQAFLTGAVDGVLNAVAPLAAEAAMEKTASALARVAAPKSFGAFATGTGKKMTEGALSGGISSAVDAAARDSTWTQGFDTGMKNVIVKGLTGAATGGAAAAAPGVLSGLIAAYGSLEALEAAVEALPEPAATYTEGHIDLVKAAASAPRNLNVQRNFGTEYEEMVVDQLMTSRFQGLPPMLSVVTGQYESNNGIDAMGFAYEGGILKMYVFEMKWKNIPQEGLPQRQVKLTPTSTKGKVQTDYEWAMICIDEFIASKTVGAQTAKNQLRMQLPRLLGETPGSRWTNEELRTYLRGKINIDQMRRVVAIPPWADARKLYRQLIALRRRGQGGFKVIRTGP